MLRITRLWQQGGSRTIKLEGQLLAPWASTVHEACTRPDPGVKAVWLDLVDVAYVDVAGVQLLQDLMRQGIQISACSRFVSELLRRAPGKEP
jgi:ABC-type transporter Mla MlaB component